MTFEHLLFGTAIGNRRQLHIRHLAEQETGEIGERRRAGLGEGERSRLRLGERNQLGHVVDR